MYKGSTRGAPEAKAWRGVSAGARGRRMPLHEDLQLIQQVPLFAGVPEASLQALVFSADRRRLEAGEWLFRAGERDGLGWLIRSGSASAWEGPAADTGEADAARLVARLTRGAFVGEVAMIADMPHRLSVRAETALAALCIPHDLFRRACAEFPQLGRQVLDNALARFGGAMDELARVRRLFEEARSFGGIGEGGEGG